MTFTERYEAWRKETEETRMRTEIVREGKKYLVSTCNTFDQGWETMVFPIMEDGEPLYNEQACKRYANQSDAAFGHVAMVQDFQPNN